MANKTTLCSPLPHENLIAYQVACDLLVAVFEANIKARISAINRCGRRAAPA
jgi:hypothetical protein